MASRAQWRFGIFAVVLQMVIKLNRIKSRLTDFTDSALVAGYTLTDVGVDGVTAEAVVCTRIACTLIDFCQNNYQNSATG